MVERIKNSLFIELNYIHYDPNDIEFLNKIKTYEKVKLDISHSKYYGGQETLNLFKYDEESKVKDFKLVIISDEFTNRYYLNFPINFENLVTLDLL